MTVTTDEQSATYVAENVSEETPARLTVTDGTVRVHGTTWDSNESLPIDDRDDIVVTVFVDRGPGSSFSYRLEVPVRTEGETIRAVTPRVERCTSIRDCGGESAYIPDRAPDGLFVRTELAVPDASG